MGESRWSVNAARIMPDVRVGRPSSDMRSGMTFLGLIQPRQNQRLQPVSEVEHARSPPPSSRPRPARHRGWPGAGPGRRPQCHRGAQRQSGRAKAFRRSRRASRKKWSRYNDFAATTCGLAPKRREMLVSHRRRGNTAQLYRLTEPMGQLEQLTFTPDPVSSAGTRPRRALHRLLRGPRAATRWGSWHRLALDTPNAEPVLLTNRTSNSFNLWLRQSGQMVFSAVPVDRTADPAARAPRSRPTST